MKPAAGDEQGRGTLALLILVVVALVVAIVGLASSSLRIKTTAATEPVGTTQGPISESAALPSSLPDNAVKVHAPILMYHYVDDTPPPAGPYADGLTVRTGDFRAEMNYLAAKEYQTVSLADVYLAMCGRKALSARAVVLTFDDGGLDNYEVAFPILKEHGFCGTFFVITKSVGEEGQMSWEQLREMAAEGMSIESHTVSHPDLREVSASRLESELARSRQAIADAIGEPSYALAYPAGAYNETVIAATRAAGYLIAVATNKGKEGDPAAVYEMKRRRVQAFLPLEGFADLVE